MKRATLADVAKRAKVSKSTVSQYLNKRFDYMSDETRLRIERSIQELGYRPNVIARSLKQKKTFTIGVIVANILHMFSTQIIRAIEDVCHEKDYHVIVCNADDNPQKEKNYIDMLRAKQVDGLIVFPTGGNVELYKDMVESNFPLVFMDRIVSDVHVDTVLLDNQEASKKAVQYLIRKGYERIAIVTTSLIQNVTPRIERVEGYKQALHDFGIPIRQEYIKGLEVTNMKEGLYEMFSLPHPPESIIAGNDLSLMEILKFLKERQLDIPDDVAVIGIDDVSFAHVYTPPLTTIKQPTFEMGKKAAELLFQKMNEPSKHENVQIYRFEPELINRESC